MPQDYKTSVNNLIIVWQGSSWSVIAPDGVVIARFLMKRMAIDFARSGRTYSLKSEHSSAEKALINDEPQISKSDASR